MTDLIERLEKEAEHLSRLALNTNNKVTKHHADLLKEAITALSPVLPDDVADAVQLCRLLGAGKSTTGDAAYNDAADLLERQARENAIMYQANINHGNDKAELRQRIERLETSNKDKGQLLASFRSQIQALEAAQSSLIEIIKRNAPEAMPAAAVAIGEAKREQRGINDE